MGVPPQNQLGRVAYLTPQTPCCYNCLSISGFVLVTSQHLIRSSATVKSTARLLCIVGVLYAISWEKIC